MRFGALILPLVGAVGVQAAVTGQKNCNKFICVTGLHDDTAKKETYTLAPPDDAPVGSNKFGWMAIGFGEVMTNTPMVIVWTNPDNTFTLSHRQASGYVMPTIVSSPPRVASLQTASSFSNDSQTSITFTIPTNTNLTSSALNTSTIIWAYSDKNPKSNWDQAKLTQHLAAGSMQIALLAPRGSTVSAGSGGVTPATSSAATASKSGTGTSATAKPSSTTKTTGSSAGTGGSTTTSSSRHKVLIAHVVCGTLATMVLIPIGSLIPRIARGLTTDRWWFPLHGVINGLLAGVLIIATFGIARANFHSHGGFDTTHRKAGLALVLLTLFQVALGIFAHYFKSPLYTLQTKSGRGPSNFIHMILGGVIIVLGWVTVWKGLTEEWPVWSGSGAASVGWKAGWGLLVAITLIGYIVGFGYFLPRQRKLEREQHLRHAGSAGVGGSSVWSGNRGSGLQSQTSLKRGEGQHQEMEMSMNRGNQGTRPLGLQPRVDEIGR